MNARSSFAIRKTWLVVGLVVVGLALAAFKLRAPVAMWLEVRNICQQLEEGAGDEQIFYLMDTSKPPQTQALAPGTYRVAVASECYSAVCTFEVLDSPKLNLEYPRYSGVDCRGPRLDLVTTSWDIVGFSTPDVLNRERVHVRIWRGGQTFYDGTPGHACPDRGFCVYPAARE